MPISRRSLFEQAGAAGLLGLLAGCRPGPHQVSADGKTLIIGQDPEPLALCSAGSIDGGASVVSVKIFDRLFNTGLDGSLQPQLALSAQISPDGHEATVNLRPNVTWHDGKPLTAADVAWSIENVWKIYHPRGQSALHNLVGVDVPSPLVAVLRFSKPTPYINSVLADGAAQVYPRHLYEGTNPLTNPYNLHPVGSGPYQFESWERGQQLVLKRNPNYWDAPRPYLERLIFRFIPDGSPTVAALESGAIQYTSGGLPLSDIARLKQDPKVTVTTLGANHSANFAGLAFNLNKPVLRDPRVRQAFAHAIDKEFILKNIWLDGGHVADSPIPPGTEWHADGLPTYPFDLAKAEALLDAAGLKRGADGTRITLYNDVMPPSPLQPRAAQYIRQSLDKIGVRLQLRSEALGSYLKRIFTDRDWDTVTYSTGSDFDPAIGIQRFYWSKSIKPGVPFTNPTHYSSPEVDRLLEAAQIEMDHDKRKALYARFQQIVQTDLPLIPILFPYTYNASTRRLDYTISTRIDNLASARFSAT